MKDCNCIFCKIANGEIPSTTLYEDEDFRVILDLGPATRGHALLLPKNHFANLFELDDETAQKAILVAKKMAGKMKDALGADGFNLVQMTAKQRSAGLGIPMSYTYACIPVGALGMVINAIANIVDDIKMIKGGTDK